MSLRVVRAPKHKRKQPIHPITSAKILSVSSMSAGSEADHLHAQHETITDPKITADPPRKDHALFANNSRLSVKIMNRQTGRINKICVYMSFCHASAIVSQRGRHAANSDTAINKRKIENRLLIMNICSVNTV